MKIPGFPNVTPTTRVDWTPTPVVRVEGNGRSAPVRSFAQGLWQRHSFGRGQAMGGRRISGLLRRWSCLLAPHPT